MLIDCAPKPELLSSAFHNDFVQIPNVAGPRLTSPQIAGDLGAELSDPTTNRLIRKRQSHAQAAFLQLNLGLG